MTRQLDLVNTLVADGRTDFSFQDAVDGKGGVMDFEKDVRFAIAHRAFQYRRCACRIHKLLPWYVLPRLGWCGTCHQLVEEPATETEYEAQ